MTTEQYDCSPHEHVAHHVARVVHNVFHPHHKWVYIPPVVQACHVPVPDMETVTITAPPVTDTPVPGGAPPGSFEGFPPDVGYYNGAYGAVYVVTGSHHPVSVPEPGMLALLVPALLFVLVRRHAQRA